MIPFRMLAVAAFAVFPTLTVGAGEPGIAEEVLRSACVKDYLRLCAAIDPNADHVEACFLARMSNVSPGCRSAIALYRMPEPKDERRSQQAEGWQPR